MFLTRKGRRTMKVCFLRNRSYRNEGTGESSRNSYTKGQRRNYKVSIFTFIFVLKIRNNYRYFYRFFF